MATNTTDNNHHIIGISPTEVAAKGTTTTNQIEFQCPSFGDN
jgi:hypothetical protein